MTIRNAQEFQDGFGNLGGQHSGQQQAIVNYWGMR